MAGVKDYLGAQNRIGRRLIIMTIAFSSLITLVISAAQLMFEYRELRNDLDRQLDQIAIYVPGISGSVWAFDEKQIGLAVDALVRLPNMDRITVVTAEGDRHWAAGKVQSERVMTRSYSLRHELDGRDAEIGTLEVTASLDGIVRRVVAHAVSIVLGNGVKTFLVAIFMFFVFRRLVTRRLEELARSVATLVPQVPIADRTAANRPVHLDELDALRWALEDMGWQLGVAVDQLRRFNEELEARVKERTAELEGANGELEAFAYSLSHDLRAPLRRIAGFARILEEDCGERLDDPGRSHLARIVTSVRRMDALVEDTLGLFKISAVELKPQPVDLSRISREVAEQLVAADPARRVEWCIGDGLQTEGDPGLLRAVMENLIGNAWKYTSKLDAARIEVGSLRDHAGLSYFVRDNGAGFDMAHAKRLFEPFQRLHSESEFPGTGVGLAIVQKIVRRHGGSVWAEASPGQGATFYFRFGA